jgi:2'-5' RNA ligase
MMKDFWDTHHWPKGERRVHWHLLFDGATDVHRLAAAHHDLLAQHEQLTPVPEQWLHATLLSIGPLEPEQAQAVGAAGQRAVAGLEPFELEIGTPQAIHNGIVALLHPEDQLHQLYRALHGATTEVLGADAVPTVNQRTWGHVSLAYSNAVWDADALTRTLVKDLREPRARMTVNRAVLVDQQQDWRSLYSWNTITTAALGAPTTTGPTPEGCSR